MKKFWMLILAAVFAMNSGVTTLWAVESLPAVTEAVEAVKEEALSTEETVIEEVEEETTEVVTETTEEVVEEDDEFSDEMALEYDKVEGSLDDMAASDLTADQKVY